MSKVKLEGFIAQRQTRKSWELDVWARWPNAIITQAGTRVEATFESTLVGFMQLDPIKLTQPLQGEGHIRYSPIS